ncbi:hypothetical protein SKAU_G00393480 [Synaphobranchus kaupii]|uniref:Uncharacterized protein n=1 Tax=Synaphobranchus kaupii TaxID=118154 RepID=A0A9Q1EC28_SYNKA|nr:hypothetical protein SKAU_G00393480 [Synaphobranchus kaupii]
MLAVWRESAQCTMACHTMYIEGNIGSEKGRLTAKGGKDDVRMTTNGDPKGTTIISIYVFTLQKPAFIHWSNWNTFFHF